jgi:hypothetical protein
MSHANLLAFFNDRPVFLELIRLVVVLLRLLLDERAGAVEFAVYRLDCDLGTIILGDVS